VRRDLFAAVSGVRTSVDAGVAAVHRVRTAGSRLAAWLELGGWTVLRDDVRWLRRRVARMRDGDVTTARGCPEPLAAWISAERPRRRREFVRALRTPRYAGLKQALGVLPPVTRERAADSLKRIARRVRRRGENVSESAPDDALHRLRRAIRRLRHARMLLGRDADELRPVVDALGSVGDDAATLALVDACPARARLADFRQELAVAAESDRRRALDAWRELRSSWRDDR
jgi:CHAD domain-containing protein